MYIPLICSHPTSFYQMSISTYTNEPSTSMPSTYHNTYKPFYLYLSLYQFKASITPVQLMTDLHADILQKMYSEVVGIKLDVKENNYIVTRLEYTINEVLIESYNNIVDYTVSVCMVPWVPITIIQEILTIK
ncbi:hypothetical protein QTP88_005304 [Uroleucon formosanum]